MVNQRGEGKIYFDRPRASAFLEKALDKVRAAKHRELGGLEKNSASMKNQGGSQWGASHLLLSSHHGKELEVSAGLYLTQQAYANDHRVGEPSKRICKEVRMQSG
jgi:hypothetical protein